VGGYGEAKDELNDTNYWLKQFQTALAKPQGTAQELITEQNIAMLLGEYENSQAFTNTPWKAYVEGNKGAISESAKKGALLFFNPISEGGADCVHCHSGDLFSDELFHNVAMPQIGRGKGDGDEGIEDFGRYRVTGKEEDYYKFRTPSLLNVEVTGPWGHDGAYTSLEAMVKHMSNPKEAVKSYDTTQLTQTGIQNLDKMEINTNKAIVKLEQDRVAGLDVLEDSNLSDSQIADVVSFLRTLTDPCVLDESCLNQWIPQTDLDPNGDQLNAVDEKGNRLGLK
jgi:cytochrome c peroxidase